MAKDQVKFTVRPGDIEEMLDVARAVTRENGGQFNRDSTRAFYSECDAFFVAECDKRLVGAVSTSTRGIRGKRGPILDSIFVLRDYYRRGIGTALCIRAIAKLVDGGHTPIHCTAISTLGRKLVMNLPNEVRKHLRVEFDPNPLLDLLQSQPVGPFVGQGHGGD